MTCKKFKSIGSLLLCVIYLMVSCALTASFAVSTDTGMNVPEGKYYIKNKGTSLYVGGYDFCSVVQTSLETSTDLQKWELEYVSNGYYRIKNLYSGYYLTAPDTLYPMEDIIETSLDETNYGQLWMFTELESGQFANHKEYKITSRTHDFTEMAMVCGDRGDYGYSVSQDMYVSDYDYYDEWALAPMKEATLVGVNISGSAHNHVTWVYNTKPYLNDNWYYVSSKTSSSYTTSQIRNYLETSNVFVLLGEGMYDDIGTLMYLNSSGSAYLHSWDIYHYNGNVGIDMSDCELAVFAGCYTANHEFQSLPQSAVNAGADYAIGFEDNVNCADASDWTERFFYYYTSDYSVAESAEMSALDMSDSNYVNSYLIFD